MTTRTNSWIEACLSTSTPEEFGPAFVLSRLDEVFRRNLYVHSMEVFEIENEGSHRLRVDLSILGLEKDWDAQARGCAEYARHTVEAKLWAALECENETRCRIWLDHLERS